MQNCTTGDLDPLAKAAFEILSMIVGMCHQHPRSMAEDKRSAEPVNVVTLCDVVFAYGLRAPELQSYVRFVFSTQLRLASKSVHDGKLVLNYGQTAGEM